MSAEAPADPRRLAEEDDRARAQALDVTRSFLVQAPAGSGKTELLIQRYLALLANVDRPEAIVAMTFTRKAAGEMRERILLALRDAAAGVPVEGTHFRRTRELAQQALAQDARQQWQLTAHPARLTIVTIDAYCAGLAGQAPLTAKLGGFPRYVDRPEALYRQAAHEALADAPAADPHWRALLAHLDNDAARLVDLVAGLLAKREQWLPLLLQGAHASRSALEATLAAEIEGELAVAAAACPPAWVAGLVPLQRCAADNLGDDPRAAALRRGAAAGGRPAPVAAALGDWQALADWLLVGEHARFRVAVDVRCGFPAPGRGPGAEDRAAAKAAMKARLAEAAATPGLAAALATVRTLPPAACDEGAWSVAAALLAVLPQVASRLLVVFNAERSIDFTQGTLAALAALGAGDDPQELLLRLDYAVAHLLLDEFQDTSYVQLELVARLTAGWVPGDGRTLFAVGDPMQSIYRFRKAEVRLFVEAQASGRIAGVPVVPLRLRRNFRSQAGLVDWVNAVFPAVLGARSDPWQGVVAFAPAVAQHPATEGPAAVLELVADDRAEAGAVVAAVRRAWAEGASEVAVLVRARPHLAAVLPALRAAAISVQAVELESLAERPAVRDLAALAHALLQPADRLAWLAVLRAPWCGLALPDLFAVAGSDALLPALARGEPLPMVADLSADGALRLAALAAAFGPALRAAGRQALAARVRGAWLALGGPATLDDAQDLDSAESFFALLARHERAGDLADWDAFVDDLAALRAGSAPGAPENTRSVQVMTLHRAKGLQFDTVIIPGLARRPARGDRPLLSWRRRPQGLLLAPTRRRGGDDDPVYAYLVGLDDREADAELGRLLYVGCTRAQRRLDLIGVAAPEAAEAEPPSWRAPGAGTALAKLWPGLGASLPPAPLATAPSPATAVPAPTGPATPRLHRFPAGWSPPPSAIGLPAAATVALPGAPVPFDWAEAVARHVGVVAHRVYARIAREGLSRWDRERVAGQRRRLQQELAAEGVDGSALADAWAALEAALVGVLGSERGRWLFAPTHEAAASEWALAGLDPEDHRLAHVVIDRSFVADGVRWIVDFKTGSHEGGDRDAFLDAEVLRYRSQLERYGRLVRQLDPRPLRLALFYPRLDGWRAWDFAA
ncbi:MAG: UvrD-helicase domain-containing protein [Betaproteobacteria bacterium]|nr:UvrD-helicase domain-containing protein [Betaproteobacteria bacterium]